MGNPFRLYLFVIFYGICLASLAGASSSNAEGEAAMMGNWISESIEDMGNGAYAVRVVKIRKKQWSALITIYGDRERKQPLFAVHTHGTYVIERASPKVQGAFDARFTVRRRGLTLLTTDKHTIKFLGLDHCGLKRGRIVDISESGCAFFPSVSACSQEYDVLKWDGSRLHLGARAAESNPCTENHRPTSLGQPLIPY